MSTKDVELIASGQRVSVPEVPAGTTLHIHLHLAGAPQPEPDGIGSRATTRPRFQGRAWLGPLLAGGALLMGYGLARTTQAPIAPAVAQVGAAGVRQDSQEASAMRTLEQQLHQPPTVIPPPGAPTGPIDKPAPNPFGLEN